MCATAEAILVDKEVGIKIGYWPGEIELGDMMYFDDKEVDVGCSREEMLRALAGHTSDELANLIMDLVCNGSEYP